MLNMLRSARQWFYPREFRIEAPAWSEEIQAELQRLIEALSTPIPPPIVFDEETYAHVLADVATGMWRLRDKMLRPGTDQPLDEMHRAYRSFESAWDALMEAGFTIQDHTNSLFNAGMFLRVLAFQPTAGIARETVIQTVRPSVYYKQQLIQPGEVIVGTPEEAKSQKTPQDQTGELIAQAPESLHQNEQGDSLS
jgi:hypothetical protein